MLPTQSDLTATGVFSSSFFAGTVVLGLVGGVSQRILPVLPVLTLSDALLALDRRVSTWAFPFLLWTKGQDLRQATGIEGLGRPKTLRLSDGIIFGETRVEHWDSDERRNTGSDREHCRFCWIVR